ncbi:hypothetical protein [Williamsia sp. CHRR-6]|uniref:hypothetical protein n=1 Tax=Williamsia sp. CHRR-6 TaxID=2835871 RepID=UPI001BD9467F|nr:hypothetical protein [Williamsia sp. CHRR-6]MBT0568624.1 hypothetical protein [Williamsia sp. CHRR-6]
MRPPVIVGLAGGVGTTIVAGLLGVSDAGVWAPGMPADVLVCRSVAHQLAAITRAAAALPTSPVVVIVADCAEKPPAAVRDRARMLEPNVAAVVWIPWLPALREVADPAAAARDAVLADHPPRWALTARHRREELLAAVTTVVATDTTGMGEAPVAVCDGWPIATGPVVPRQWPNPQASSAAASPGPLVPAWPPTPSPPTPPPPAAGYDRWSVAPDAPPSRQGPRGSTPQPRTTALGSTGADGLRRTS